MKLRALLVVVVTLLSILGTVSLLAPGGLLPLPPFVVHAQPTFAATANPNPLVVNLGGSTSHSVLTFSNSTVAQSATLAAVASTTNPPSGSVIFSLNNTSISTTTTRSAHVDLSVSNPDLTTAFPPGGDINVTITPTGALNPTQFILVSLNMNIPANRAQIVLTCQSLIPVLPNCTSTSILPFEAIVYDANNDGLFNAGDSVIVGASPPVGTRLAYDTGLKWRDATCTSTNFATCHWTASDPIFYSPATNTSIAGRVFLYGSPTTLTTFIHVTGATPTCTSLNFATCTDLHIKFAQTDNCGTVACTTLQGVVEVKGKLVNVGGILADGSEQDVMAQQIIYTFNPSVLQALCNTTPCGSTLSGQFDAYCVGQSIATAGGTCGSPVTGHYTFTVDTYCIDSGGSALDTISPDNANGKISSSSLCSQGPPSNSDTGIGCDPNYGDPVRTAGATCPGNFVGPPPSPAGAPNPPLLNVTSMIVEFLVTGFSAGFTIQNVASAPGVSGSSLTDIDGVTSTNIPVVLVSSSFSNMAAHTTTTGVSCSPSSISVNTLTTCTATVTDPAASGAVKPTGSVSFQSSGSGIFNPTSCTLASGATLNAATCSATYNATAVGTGTHTITGVYNGDGSHQGSLGTFPVTVSGALPPLTITANCGTNTGTVGKPITCTSAASGGTRPYTFGWKAPGGSPATAGNQTTFTVMYATKGTFTVNATLTDSTGKTVFQLILVTITGQPIVDNGSCGTATAGKPVTCTASPTGGTGPYTITWASSGTPGTGTGASYTTTFATKGTFTVTLNVTDANRKFTVQTITVVVGGQPIVDNGSCGAATAGKPVTCTASPTGGTTPYTISWRSTGTPATGTSASYTTTFATKGTFSVTLNVTDANNKFTVQTISVVVTGQPIVDNGSCGAATAGKPVTCTASPTGGTTPYTIRWSSTGSPATGTGASYTTTFAAKGTFSVTLNVTDSNNKFTIQTISVAVAAQPIVDNGSCGPAIAGQPDTCTASPTGGTAPYTITWKSAGSPPSATGTTYTVTFAAKGPQTVTLNVTDANRKFTVQTINVGVTGSPIVDNGSCSTATAGKPVTCNAAPTGGTTPYTITWRSTGTPATGTGASYTTTFATKGTFSVTLNVTDANRASTIQTISVTVAGQPIVDNGSCGSATAGKPVTCSASPTGGTSPYTITWRSTGTPATGTGTSYTTTFATKGTFSVTLNVTDVNAKFTVQTISVVVAGQPIVDNGSCGAATAGKPVTCTASPTGGTTPYTIRWSSTGSPATGTGASYTTTFAAKGTFSVTLNVTDANNKFTVQTISVVVAGQPIVDNGSCGAATAGKPATCTAAPTGGTTPYTITWRSTGTPATGSGASYTTTFATKGSFSVTLNVTDANRKFTVQTISVTVTGQPIVDNGSCGTATAGKPVTCTASPTGGTTPYTIAWRSTGTPATGTGASYTTTFATKGTFSVTLNVTDANRKFTVQTLSVVVAGQPIVDNGSCGAATAGKPVTCTASPTGGTTPYTITWRSTGTPATGTGASYTTTFATKGTFSVTLNVTDANSKFTVQTISVSVTAQPIVVTASCNNANVNSPVNCTVSATGGTSPITFAWSAPGGTPSSGTGPTFTTSYSTTGNKNINVTATDTNNQHASKIIVVSIGAALQITASCAGGANTGTVGKPVACTASASGGTPPYTFSWSAPGGSPASAGNVTSLTVTYSAKGTFNINATVTDRATPTGKSSVLIPVTITGQPIVDNGSCGTATAGKPVTCTASPTGGTAPYTIAWRSTGTPATGTGASYTTTFATKGTFSVTLNVTDANRKFTVQTISVSVAGQPIVDNGSCGAATAGKPVTCTAAPTGGTTPYTITWRSTGTPATGTGASYTTTFATKGTFSVTLNVTDANLKFTVQTISVAVAAQPIVDNGSCGAATAGKPVTCTAAPTGGTTPYTITWRSTGTPATGTGASYTTTFATKGTFSVTLNVTDANRKFTVQTISVSVAGQPIVDNGSCGAATAGKPVTCTASPTGGTTPYTITWRSTGTPATGTGASYTTTFATKGTFSVTLNVTDANSKFTVQTISVSVAGQPIVDNGTCGTATAGKPVTCTASPTGGTTPYTITWRSTGTPATGSGASYTTTFATKGSFSVTLNVTDANRKFTVQTISVVVAGQPIVDNGSCGAATAGKPITCTATPTGGTAPYTITWRSTGTPATGTGASYTTTFATKGTFSVTLNVTDVNAKFTVQTITVGVTAQPIVITASCNNAAVNSPVNCSASATGGTSPITFAWSAPGGTPSSGTGPTFTTSYSTTGTKSINVTATDGNNVHASKIITVIIGAGLQISASCAGGSNTGTVGKPVACSASATGGTPPYTFSWSAPGGSPASAGNVTSFTVTYSAKGTFNINATVTDKATPTGKSSVLIPVTITGQPIVDNGTCGTATAGKPVTCTASPTGGTAPYTIAWRSTGTPATGTGTSYTTTFATKGTFSVTLNVTDANRKFTVQTLSVVVAGQPIVDNGSCGAATAGKPVTCTAAPTGGTIPYTITWASTGSPATGSGTSYTTTFATKGTFTVTLNVTDANRKFTVQTITVAVAAQPIVDNGSCGAGTAGKPVTCTAAPTGGTTPYTITWRSTGTPATGSGASYTTTFATKGTFSVTLNVTDANRKFTVQTISVSVAAQPIVDNGSCGSAVAGQPDTCTASPTGGTAPYTITWRSAGTPPTATGPTYTVTFASKGPATVTLNVTDTNNKFTVQTINVAVTGTPIVDNGSCGAATAGKPVTCTAAPTGGTTPYTITWKSTGTPATGSGTSYTTTFATKGTFSVTLNVTDANRAFTIQTISVTVTGQPIVDNGSCGAATAGKPVTCTASPTGGTTPYTISWRSTGTPATGTGASYTTTFAAKGTFSVTLNVTDANNKFTVQTISVAVAAQPIVDNGSCGPAVAGQPDTCTASPTGGTTPYTITWKSAGTPPSATGNTYTVTFAAKGPQTVTLNVTDANRKFTVQTINVGVTGTPIVDNGSCGAATAGKPVTCTASPSGGTTPYTITWSSSGSPTTGSGASYTTTFATKGSFSVRLNVTDANRAFTIQTISVTVTGQPIVDNGSCGAATAGKPVTCNAAPTGGTTPYSIAWKSTGSPATGTGASYTTTFATKGTFGVTLNVTDANSKFTVQTISVAVAAQPIVDNGSCGPAVAGQPDTCTASPTGGTTPYTITWKSAGTPSTGSGTTYTVTFSSKGPATVTLNVTDANRKFTVQTITVAVTGTPIVDNGSCGAATAGKPVTCTAAPSGGTPPYTITWKSTGTPATGSGTSYTTTFATKGTFSVTLNVTDANRAFTIQTISVTVTGQPIVDNGSCGTATAGKPVTCTASPTGGTTPYTISWRSTGTPATGTGASYTTTFATKGTFSVTLNVTDANRKFTVQTISVAVTGQPIVITASCSNAAVNSPVNCSASATGGTSPITFAWSAPGGTPSSGTGATFTTSYSTTGTKSINVTATDGNNVHASKIITVIIGAGLQISASCGTNTGTVGKPVNCTASATGGTPPYTFSWSAPGGSPASAGNVTSFQTMYSAKGTFNIIANVTDHATPIGKSATTIVVTITGQPIVDNGSCGTASAGKPVTCNAAPTGGTSPYTITWKSAGNPSTGSGTSYTTTFAAKGPQTVTLNVTDANRKFTVQTISVNVAGQQFLVSASCASATSGKPVTCTASVTGGTAPYTITWASAGSPATGSGTSYTTTFSVKGTYTVTVNATDANHASRVQSITVTVNPQPLMATVSCPSSGLTAGKPFSCNVTATGGTPPYSGTGSQTVTEPAKGTYTVSFTVRDMNQASATGSTTVTVSSQPLMLTANCPSTGTAGKPVTCNASTTGGSSPVTISWTATGGSPASGTGASFTTSYAVKGSYSIMVSARDANGVSTSAQSFPISITPQPFMLTENCPSTGTVNQPVNCTASTTGGTSPVSFSWSAPGGSPSTGSGSSFTTMYATAGTYTITVTATDTNGATATKSAQIMISGVQKQPLVLTSFTINPQPVFQNQTRTLTANYTGGTGPFTCVFNFGDSTPNAIVKVTTQSCSVTHTYNVAFVIPTQKVVIPPVNFNATVTVTGQNTGDMATGSLVVHVHPEPVFQRQGLSWKHNLAFPTDQVFGASIQNPSQIDLLVRVQMVFSAPDGSIDVFNSPAFAIPSGATLCNTGSSRCFGPMSYSYHPRDGLGTYTFTAAVQYGVDSNHDGMLQDSELLGTVTDFSGSFIWT